MFDILGSCFYMSDKLWVMLDICFTYCGHVLHMFDIVGGHVGHPFGITGSCLTYV